MHIHPAHAYMLSYMHVHICAHGHRVLRYGNMYVPHTHREDRMEGVGHSFPLSLLPSVLDI